MDRNEMLKQAAQNLLKLADALDAVEPQAPAPEAVEEAAVVGETPEFTFKCSDCGHSVPLAEINSKNHEAAGDAEIEDITDEDRVRCPECDTGIMVAVEGEEQPEAQEPETTPEPAPAEENKEEAPAPPPAGGEKPAASQNSPQAHYSAPDQLEKEAGLKDIVEKARKLPEAAKQIISEAVSQGSKSLDKIIENTESTDVNPAMKAFQMFLYGPHGVENKPTPVDPYDQGFREAGFEMDASLSPQGIALGFLLFLGVANNVFAADQVKPGNIRHLLEMPKMEQVVNANKAQLEALGQKALDSVEKSQKAIQEQKTQNTTPTPEPEKAPTPNPADDVWRTASFAHAIKLASEGFDW